MSTQYCDDSFKATNRKKAINVSDKFIKYGDKTIRLNDIIVYTKDFEENKDYRRVNNIYTNCGNVYIDAGFNSFPEILFDYIKVVDPQDLSLIDILKMFTYEIHHCFDFDDELADIYKNIIDKKYNNDEESADIYKNIIDKKCNRDEPIDHSDSEDTYAGLTKDELQALGWFLIYKSKYM